MKNYYINNIGNRLYNKLLNDFNKALKDFAEEYNQRNRKEKLFKLINLAILGVELDIYGGKPYHYDTKK